MFPSKAKQSNAKQSKRGFYRVFPSAARFITSLWTPKPPGRAGFGLDTLDVLGAKEIDPLDLQGVGRNLISLAICFGF